MLRTASVVLGALAVAAPARAETRAVLDYREPVAEPRGGSAIAFGAITEGGRLDAVHVELRGLRATLTFALSTASPDGDEVVLDFEVPVGTQATYLGISVGGVRRIAHLERAEVAVPAYERIIAWKKDPALLEWLGTTRTADRLRLRVFPLTSSTPADVEILMTLPLATSVVVDPGPHRIASLPRPRRLELALESGATIARDRIDGARSLFIAEPFVSREAMERAEQAAWADQRRRQKLHPRAFTVPKECLDNPLAPTCM